MAYCSPARDGGHVVRPVLGKRGPSTSFEETLVDGLEPPDDDADLVAMKVQRPGDADRVWGHGVIAVIGRRNHFGSKSARGTQMAAILYTLVETAKVCGVDPIAYLVEAATRAKRAPGAVLLPADFKAAA